MLIDRLIFVTPVDGEPEPMPYLTEGDFVFLDQAEAGFDEVGPRHETRGTLANLCRRLLEDHALFVGRIRIAANVEVVLDTPLRRQAIVVPTHRVEDVHARHALVTHDDVCVGIRKNVADMQCARGRRRRRIDDEGFLAGA